jgi:hypothetical protein
MGNWISEDTKDFPDYKAITEAWGKDEKYEADNVDIEPDQARISNKALYPIRVLVVN